MSAYSDMTLISEMPLEKGNILELESVPYFGGLQTSSRIHMWQNFDIMP